MWPLVKKTKKTMPTPDLEANSLTTQQVIMLLALASIDACETFLK